MKENSVAGHDPLVQRFLEMLAAEPSEEACQQYLINLDDYRISPIRG